MDHLAEYRSTMIMSTDLSDEEGKTQEWLLFIGFMLRFTPSAALLYPLCISCPLTSDDVPYSLHFALAYKITVHNIFGSETIIGIRCNSYEKSLFLNCKNKAMYLFTIMIWVIFETYKPIPIYTSYSAFWSPFSMRNQRNLGKIGENLSSPSFLLPLCSFACWCDITFFSEAGMYYVCRYLVG